MLGQQAQPSGRTEKPDGSVFVESRLLLRSGQYDQVLAVLRELEAKNSFAVSAQESRPIEASTTGYVGNEVCSRCHASIYASYSRTNMAHASGPAEENLIPADFTHATSGVHYRIYREDGHVWLSFDRPGDPSVHGRRQLLYYIGSGHRGLTYLFSVDGFFFESPINWYGNSHIWDMTPAYQNAKEIPFTLPAFASCMHCHISEMQPPINGTENHYATPLIKHSGVTCERCHGPGASHANGGPIVNPAKLSPERRDQVCMQCHMEGKVAIERAGRHAYEYRPGDNLLDFLRYFVFENNAKLGAVSQVEAMSQSTCKKKSGDRMSCTSCHEAHYSPSAADRISYYRAKCLACHGAPFGAKHHAEKPDCTSCHMPTPQSTDVAHTQVTDHRIPRWVPQPPQLLQDANLRPVIPRLVEFPDAGETKRDVRDLALAWQSLALGGMESAWPEVESVLRTALKQSPNDTALLSAAGYLEQKKGKIEAAREFYKKALALDPSLIDVSNNLGVIEARRGSVSEAVKVWQDAYRRAPGRSGLGMNIARVFCEAGQFDEARTFLLRVLEFNPDYSDGKMLWQTANHDPPSCGSPHSE
jgi:hypothetical protein